LSRPIRKTTKEGAEKTLLSDWRSLLKKCLTGPTLLEMSGYGVDRDWPINFRVADNSPPGRIFRHNPLPTKQTKRELSDAFGRTDW
jgi:hypothetical protein